MRVLSLTMLGLGLACGGGSETTTPGTNAPKAAAEAPKAPPPPAEPGGYFVWFNPAKTLYRSAADGTGWKPVQGAFPDALHNWYVTLASDAGGRLYVGKGLDNLYHSDDAGKTWAPVTQATPPTGSVEYKFCGGAADELFAVGSDGSGLYSTTAGQSWTAVRVAPEGASGAGDGFRGGCAFGAGGELLVDAWYFDPAGPVTATSKDHGATWTKLPRAANNTATSGLGWSQGAVWYAQNGGYTGAKVSRLDAATGTWTETPELKGTADREWAMSVFASDGKRIVGWENPAKAPSGPAPSAAHVSTDGGRTFQAVPGPVASDPTPDSWDEYVAIGWHNGETPGPMPAARPG
ncbi:MAG: hypothetical protein Q8P18_19860 [Pseudomonadota bacterium]|nr:hypothetical protein [Pseudomonadota bacterium]